MTDQQLESWRPYIFRCAKSRPYCLSEDNAEDATQDVLVALIQVEGERKYVIGAIKNQLKEYIKRKDAQVGGVEYLEDVREDSGVDSEGDDEPTVEIVAYQDLSGIEVDEFLESLPERQRLLARLLFAGESQAEAAKAMGISRQAVDDLLKKVQKGLADWLL